MAGAEAERGSPASMEAKAKPPKLDCLRKSLRDPVGFILVKISRFFSMTSLIIIGHILIG